MKRDMIYCWLLLCSINLPLTAQDKTAAAEGGKPVDETKAMLGDLYRLGDPAINKMLPDLYWALKATEGEATGGATGKSKGVRMPDVMSILRNPSVRHEIEMLDEQYEDLQDRRSTIVGEMNQQILGLLNSQGGDPLELRAEIVQIRARAEEATEKAVLPFQFERLRQLQYHILMQRVGAVNVLINDPLATELGISDEQKAELREAAKEIDDELAREIAKLRSQAMQDLFSRLKQNQQIKLSKIMGDEFHYMELPKGQRKPIGSKKPTSAANGK
jgi:hypothetical protein